MLYQIQATHEGGTRQVPTFYLDSGVRGITDAKHAATIAADIIGNDNTEDIYVTPVDDETHNGWCNRETWAANLHLSNDEGLYCEALDITCEEVAAHAEWIDRTYASGTAPRGVTPALKVGEALVDLLNEIDDPMVIGDIGSFWRIDRRELGAAWVANLKEIDES